MPHNAQRATVVERAESGWSERDARAAEIIHLADRLDFAVDELHKGAPLDDR